MMKILVFDNYDSFTYNLVHLVRKVSGYEVDVFRNNEISLDQVNEYDKIILSPGPGLPSEAGNLISLIRAYAGKKSILGVCLGHQAIGEAFGGKLLNLEEVFHGVATPVTLSGENAVDDALFRGLPSTFPVGRYHSWIISDEGLPEALQVTARDDNGNIMALQHRVFDLRGVQFHPESVLTPDGEKILENWIFSDFEPEGQGGHRGTQ